MRCAGDHSNLHQSGWIVDGPAGLRLQLINIPSVDSLEAEDSIHRVYIKFETTGTCLRRAGVIADEGLTEYAFVLRTCC